MKTRAHANIFTPTLTAASFTKATTGNYPTAHQRVNDRVVAQTHGETRLGHGGNEPRARAATRPRLRNRVVREEAG